MLSESRKKQLEQRYRLLELFSIKKVPLDERERLARPMYGKPEEEKEAIAKELIKYIEEKYGKPTRHDRDTNHII